MYNLLANGDVSTMKLLSSSGVLPGAGGGGATLTYSPSKQKCDSGCALDGTGCGALGNDIDLDRCPGGPVSGPDSGPDSGLDSGPDSYPNSPESDPPVSLFRPLNRSGLRLSVSKINCFLTLLHL